MSDDKEWNIPAIQRIFSSQSTEIARIADDAGIDKSKIFKNISPMSIPFTDHSIIEFDIDGTFTLFGTFEAEFRHTDKNKNVKFFGRFISITTKKDYESKIVEMEINKKNSIKKLIKKEELEKSMEIDLFNFRNKEISSEISKKSNQYGEKYTPHFKSMPTSRPLGFFEKFKPYTRATKIGQLSFFSEIEDEIKKEINIKIKIENHEEGLEEYGKIDIEEKLCKEIIKEIQSNDTT